MKVRGVRKCSEGGRVHMLSKPGTVHTCLGCICEVMRAQIYFLIRRNQENSLSFNSNSVTSGTICVCPLFYVFDVSCI